MKWLSLTLLVALIGATPAALAPAMVSHLDEAADTMVSAHLSPGVSVAIAESGRVVYVRNAGTADASTAYAIGSVTKMFTAVSIFQLVDRGVVKLDDPLSKYLPDFPHASDITVRELLAHRSGVPNYADAAVRDGLVYQPTTPRQLVARFAKLPLDFAPGTKWAYSNSGYVLLGQIVETVTHETLSVYEDEHIFAPAGMAQTAMGRVPPGTNLAEPYYAPDGLFLKLAPADLSWYYACGDIVSTATDLAKFDLALMGGKLVKHASFEAMQKIVSTSTLAKGYDDGLGMFVRSLAGVTITGHHGGEPGYTADNELIPRDGRAVVILDNGFAGTESTLTAVIAALFGTAVAQSPDETDAQQRFETFLANVRKGVVDRSTLDDAMNGALTPDAISQLSSMLGSWGAVNSIVFVRKIEAKSITSYYFRVTCENGAHVVEFPLDDGTKKIAGFLLTGG